MLQFLTAEKTILKSVLFRETVKYIMLTKALKFWNMVFYLRIPKFLTIGKLFQENRPDTAVYLQNLSLKILEVSGNIRFFNRADIPFLS